MKFSQEQINRALNQAYDSRLKKHCISTDPKVIGDKEWIDDVTKWPDIDDGKLFGYILQVKAITDYIGVYKDQKAYSYWMSSFVGTVWYSICPTDNNMCFIKADVSPSQRIHDDAHHVWVCFKKFTVVSLFLHHGVLALLDQERLVIMS